MWIVNANVPHTELSQLDSPLTYIVLGVEGLEAIAGVLETLPFQEIEELVKHDLQRARDARPEMFKLLRAEYQNNTLMSENNAQKLLSY